MITRRSNSLPPPPCPSAEAVISKVRQAAFMAAAGKERGTPHMRMLAHPIFPSSSFSIPFRNLMNRRLITPIKFGAFGRVCAYKDSDEGEREREGDGERSRAQQSFLMTANCHLHSLPFVGDTNGNNITYQACCITQSSMSRVRTTVCIVS